MSNKITGVLVKLFIKITMGFVMLLSQQIQVLAVMPKDIQEDLRDMMQTLAGRSISDEELKQLVSEFLIQNDDPQCNKCKQALENDREKIELIRNKPLSPAANIFRHQYTQLTYFNEKVRGSLTQRLIAEGDPILVVDENKQRLMTRSDIVAAINIALWSRSGGMPKERSFSDEEITKVARGLRQFVNQGEMPPLWNFIGALWHGHKREWGHMNMQDRNAVTHYVQNPYSEPLPVELMARLLDLSHENAQQFYHRLKMENFNHNVNRLTSLLGQWQGIQGIFSIGSY